MMDRSSYWGNSSDHMFHIPAIRSLPAYKREAFLLFTGGATAKLLRGTSTEYHIGGIRPQICITEALEGIVGGV